MKNRTANLKQLKDWILTSKISTLSPSSVQKKFGWKESTTAGRINDLKKEGVLFHIGSVQKYKGSNEALYRVITNLGIQNFCAELYGVNQAISWLRKGIAIDHISLLDKEYHSRQLDDMIGKRHRLVNKIHYLLKNYKTAA